MNGRWMRALLIAALALGLTACADDGADGAPGMDGTDGANGADGTNGTDGADGSDGSDGSDGADGVDGSDGQDGLDGLNVTEDPLSGLVAVTFAGVAEGSDADAGCKSIFSSSCRRGLRLLQQLLALLHELSK